MIAFHRIAITLRPLHGLKLERPQQLRDGEEHVSLRQVDAGTDAATDAVAVVVAGFPFAGRIFGGESRVVGVAIWVEGCGVGNEVGVEVHAPGVDDDDGAFGEEFAVDPVV